MRPGHPRTSEPDSTPEGVVQMRETLPIARSPSSTSRSLGKTCAKSHFAKLSSDPSQVMVRSRWWADASPGRGEERPTRIWAPPAYPSDRHATCAPRRPSWLRGSICSSMIAQTPLKKTSRRPYSQAPLASALPPTRRAAPSSSERHVQQ